MAQGLRAHVCWAVGKAGEGREERGHSLGVAGGPGPCLHCWSREPLGEAGGAEVTAHKDAHTSVFRRRNHIIWFTEVGRLHRGPSSYRGPT